MPLYVRLGEAAMSRCLRLNGWRIIGRDELDDDQLQEPPLSAADHRPCGLAISGFH